MKAKHTIYKDTENTLHPYYKAQSVNTVHCAGHTAYTYTVWPKY